MSKAVRASHVYSATRRCGRIGPLAYLSRRVISARGGNETAETGGGRRRWGAAREIAASALCLGYGVAVHRVVPHAAYVPSNVSAAALSLLLARRLGAGWDDLGVRTDRLATGLRTGLVSAASLAAAVGVGVALPLARRFFLDERVTRSTRPLSTVLVRIPLGTAFGEEVMFRGALLGLLLRRHPPGLASALTSTRLLLGSMDLNGAIPPEKPMRAPPNGRSA